MERVDRKMRILIITPSAFPNITGNAVTVERWRRALTKKGIVVEVLPSEGLAQLSVLDRLKQFRPDIIHAYHAFKAGSLLANPMMTLPHSGPAVVASLGGTDINNDLSSPEKRETVLKVFQMARIIIAQSPEIIQRFKLHLPDLAGKTIYVPKSVCWFGDDPYDLRGAAECGPENILFLLPSGIRPVKGNLECLKVMKRVHEIRPKIRFIAAGPPIDSEYARRFERETAELSSFVRWIKNIPSSAMRSVYRASDIVLNASFSEGLSNSLLEAIAAGCPVLASNIPGNHWLVMGENGDAPAGLLYDLHITEDFIGKALRLIDDQDFRASLARAAYERQSRWPDSEAEADSLIAAYNIALEGNGERPHLSE
jgi:L-malate glycosyltransferase